MINLPFSSQPPQRTGQDNLQWLFVVQRSHDLEGMGEIRVSHCRLFSDNFFDSLFFPG